MKKTQALINAPLSSIIASLGHTDILTIADAGLPIPPQTTRIDLALTRGIPSFLDTLKVVIAEMCVEKAILAEEILSYSPAMAEEIKTLMAGVPIEMIPHTQFKKMSEISRAVVRTGEFTPYSNIHLIAGAWGFNLEK